MEKEKLYQKSRIFSFDILLNILMFSMLGFVIAILFFSFNSIAYILLTGGGVLTGAIIGIIQAKREARKIPPDQDKNENS